MCGCVVERARGGGVGCLGLGDVGVAGGFEGVDEGTTQGLKVDRSVAGATGMIFGERHVYWRSLVSLIVWWTWGELSPVGVGGSSRLSFDKAVAYALDEAVPPAAVPSVAEPATPLTRREQQVAELVAEGLSNKEIAAGLVISQRTAEGHVENILVKLGLANRAQVVAWMAAQR